MEQGTNATTEDNSGRISMMIPRQKACPSIQYIICSHTPYQATRRLAIIDHKGQKTTNFLLDLRLENVTHCDGGRRESRHKKKETSM
jgi:hypothetical protein